MASLAFLGTGLLGSGLAEAAARRGDDVTVWNRTIQKARALEPFGARVAQTPADAVRGVERVHLVLTDDAVVEQVIAALRPGLGAHTVIVDHSTTLPKLTAARAQRLSAEGVKYIHCPVFIGPAAARAGKGTILSSGPRALFDEIHDGLSRMAERVVYLGSRPDIASVYKLCGNACIIGITGMMADVFAIAAEGDVSSQDAMKLFEFFNPSGTITGRGAAMAKSDFSPSFELTMARKDVRLMIETASGRPLSVLPGIAARMDTVIAEGHGAEDLVAIGKDSVR